MNILPTDLDRARSDAEIVQKGYYDKEALHLANGYKSALEANKGSGIQLLDPRIVNGQPMLGARNAAVTVNTDLMAEIKYANEMRAF